MTEYEALLQQVLTAVERKENHGEAFSRLVAQWAKVGNALVKAAGDLDARFMSEADYLTKTHYRQLVTSMWLASAAGVMALLLSLATAAHVIRHLNTVVPQAVERLQAAADRMGDVAEQVTRSSQGIAARAAEQANVLRTTSAASAVISTEARTVANQAQTMQEALIQSQCRSVQAQTLITGMSTSMAQIKSAHEKAARTTQTIDQIAFQTNILALNAAWKLLGRARQV